SWLSSLYGPELALSVGETLSFGMGALLVCSMLRVASLRISALAVLDVVFVGTAFTELVIAHRHGAINRPFDVADPIIAQGGDPVNAFLAVGIIATVVVVLLLLREASGRRSLLHLLVIMAALAGASWSLEAAR